MTVPATADPRKFEHACLGKERFPSESAARAALRTYMRQPDFSVHGALMVYPCRFCNEWHIGHGSPLPPRKRKERA